MRPSWGCHVDDATRSKIAETVAYQGDGERQVMEEHDLEIEQVEEIMLEEGFERCVVCQWWEEAGALVDKGDAAGYQHEDCR